MQQHRAGIESLSESVREQYLDVSGDSPVIDLTDTRALELYLDDLRSNVDTADMDPEDVALTEELAWILNPDMGAFSRHSIDELVEVHHESGFGWYNEPISEIGSNIYRGVALDMKRHSDYDPYKPGWAYLDDLELDGVSFCETPVPGSSSVVELDQADYEDEIQLESPITHYNGRIDRFNRSRRGRTGDAHKSVNYKRERMLRKDDHVPFPVQQSESDRFLIRDQARCELGLLDFDAQRNSIMLAEAVEEKRLSYQAARAVIARAHTRKESAEDIEEASKTITHYKGLLKLVDRTSSMTQAEFDSLIDGQVKVINERQHHEKPSKVAGVIGNNSQTKTKPAQRYSNKPDLPGAQTAVDTVAIKHPQQQFTHALTPSGHIRR